MSETNVVVSSAEVPKKRRGCPPGGWPKKNKVEVTKSALPKAMDGEALERFAYKATEGEMDDWEANEDVSPMHVPKEIRDRYPDLSFRYVSDYSVRTRGANYHGWQKFSDKNFPDGVKRGNDMFLAAMPKKRAERYRQRVSELSIDRIRSQQENSIQFMVSEGSMSQQEMDEIARKKGRPDLAGGEGGLVVGVRPTTKTRFGNRTITGGGYTRGMSREEAREIVRKEIADRKKHRVYSIPKG